MLHHSTMRITVIVIINHKSKHLGENKMTKTDIKIDYCCYYVRWNMYKESLVIYILESKYYLQSL